jgi:hypothetical protein
MNFTRWATVAILAAMLHLHAQTPTPIPTQSSAPASGPTMEQTIAFINDAFIKEGIISMGTVQETSQSADLESPCLLAYHTTQRTIRSGETVTLNMWKIDLEKDDPLTLKIIQFDTYYGIQIIRSAYSDEPNLAFSYVGVFRDKTTAERVAKAYIHAMVLCHKPEAPSLF